MRARQTSEGPPSVTGSLYSSLGMPVHAPQVGQASLPKLVPALASGRRVAEDVFVLVGPIPINRAGGERDERKRPSTHIVGVKSCLCCARGGLKDLFVRVIKIDSGHFSGFLSLAATARGETRGERSAQWLNGNGERERKCARKLTRAHIKTVKRNTKCVKSLKMRRTLHCNGRGHVGHAAGFAACPITRTSRPAA